MVNVEIFGLIGAVLTVIAYYPQARHIMREHCVGGISTKTWLIWLMATVLILIYAITARDRIFILLETANIIAIISILILIRIYGNRVCHSSEGIFKKKSRNQGGRRR